jgi:hypothetical protein
MDSPAARFTGLTALVLVVAAGLAGLFAPTLAPALDAGLAGAASLCAPFDKPKADGMAPRPARLRDPATLRVPRCGVA